jgi:hypothetical protein
MMSMSDYFVGTCVSSFSSFVSRYRAISGAPTEFWGVSDHGEPPLTKETIGTSIDDHELWKNFNYYALALIETNK